MRIVERIKDAVEHTTDSWQQKLLNDFQHGDDPSTRARKIISELLRPLDKPNQIIVNDIVSLIYALASNPDPSIDLDQIVSTAQLLIHELVEPIPNPDKKLMDELLQLVIHAAHTPIRKNAQIEAARPQNQGIASQNQPTVSQTSTNTSQSQQSAPPNNQSPPAQQSTPQPTTSVAPAPQPSSSKSPVDQTMLKLIMDEMKEVIKKNQLAEQRITDTDNKTGARIGTIAEDIEAIKEKVKKQGTELEGIMKNMDKFISLYEIVINQYNPFIEHIEEPKKKDISQEQPKVQVQPAVEPKHSEVKPQEQISDDHDNLSNIMEEVKKMSDSDFNVRKIKLSTWISSAIKDEELAKAFSQSKTPQDAIKLLLKKSLQMHTS
jgi:hypothetical protein